MSKRKNNRNGQRDRPYSYMLVQQPQYLNPPYDTLDRLIKRIKTIGADRYAGILHDKDTGEKPHITIFMHFPNGREVIPLAKKLNIAPQYLEIWDEGIDNGFAYLAHRTPDAKEDYQYSPNEVIANFDYAAWLSQYEAKQQKKGKHPSHKGDIDHLLDCLYIGIVNREDVEKQLSGSQYAKYHKKIDDVCAKRLQKLAEERAAERKAKGEKVKVVWIYGVAGTGKTRFAKEQASKQFGGYYITGSSRDPFQRYAGEDIIIYDEARPGDIPFSDLLKLLDPYGEDVAAPSRYYDKAICAGTFYITSPYSPWEYYKKIMGEGWIFQPDKYEQLLRRLTLIIKMTEENIQPVQYDVQKQEFLSIPGTARKNTYCQEQMDDGNEAMELFNSFFVDLANKPKSEELCEQVRVF